MGCKEGHPSFFSCFYFFHRDWVGAQCTACVAYAKQAGAGAATIASAGAAIGIGNVLSSSIHSVARNPSLAKQSFGYAILGFALTEAIASFAPMMAFLISSVFRSKKEVANWEGSGNCLPPGRRTLDCCRVKQGKSVLVFGRPVLPMGRKGAFFTPGGKGSLYSRNLLLNQYRQILDAHEGIARRIIELRAQEGLSRCGGFQAERLSEIFEEKYGGERMAYGVKGRGLAPGMAGPAPLLSNAVAPGASACYLRIAPWISSEMFDASWGFFGDRKAKTAPRIWVARGRLCPDGGALWGRAQPNRDSTPPTSSAPLYRLNHSKGLIGGTGEPRELAVDSLIREGKKGPKHGRCRTLEWKRKAGPYLFFQACSGIRFPRKIKLMSRVMGNLPARFGEH
ncbi:hypothetical protein E3N88_44228 [Mikania micrantha]|uniref:ATP synthase subunit 9, mitochondrial n=1 Tax=Mikania micrantha TaxID=192012 RepID=A0A5N6L7K4_9ASTR|nr:hypothetical protein E3N88_46096 [Mikania micrantha]KAD0468654.1 hypothetical protein E3N88_44228 [Mikania micrantha]